MSVLRCAILCALIACVLGHGILVTPSPLNPNPTTGAPCGVDLTSSAYNAPTKLTPSITWVAGNQVQIVWKAIASDVGQTFSGFLATNGANKGNPTFTQVFADVPSPTAGGATYPATFTIDKDLRCNSDSLCLFKITSSGNWVSCSLVNITCDGCPPPPPAPKHCAAVKTDLQFCPSMNDKNVYILPSDDPASLDAATMAAYYKNINNTNVFLNGNSTDCKKQYSQFLCNLNLPPCPGSGQTHAIGEACRSQCNNMAKACQVNSKHEALYDCDSLPPCPGDSASTISLSIVAVVALIAAMLL